MGSTSLQWLLLLTMWLCCRATRANVTVNMSAHPGQEVNLTCQSDNSVPVGVVQWTRPDPTPLQHVFLYIDGHFDIDYQNPSFKNRVKPIDGEMKNGDLSLTLKNVTKDDSGTYECRCLTDGARRRKRDVIPSEPISIIRLQVSDPPVWDQQNDKDPDPEGPAGPGPAGPGPAGRGHAAVGGTVTLAVIVAAAVVVFVILRKQRAPGQDFNPDHSEIQA